MSNLTKNDPLDMAIGGGVIWKRGLREVGKISREQDGNLGLFANRAGECVNWLVGDLILRWERVYGEDMAVQMAAEYFSAFKDDQVIRARWVAEKYQKSAMFQNIADYPRHIDLAWTYYSLAGGLPTLEERVAILQEAYDEDWSTSDLRLEVRKRKLAKTAESNPLPKGKYNLIYADPPWQYDFSSTDNRKIENHYPTMEVDAICELEVNKLAHDDCVLFLWATSPKLREALQVIEEWGFEYKTCMVWNKDKIGMGYYARQKHELLLIATCGHPALPPESTRPESVVDAPRGRHSAKPEVFYELIEKMYPCSKRIELFARGERKGWHVWGNEVRSSA